VLEIWGVEVGLCLGSGKVKTLGNRPTLHRRTTTTYILKRPSSRQTLSEIVKKFGTFPFSLRQLEDEKAGKVGVVECSGNMSRPEMLMGAAFNHHRSATHTLSLPFFFLRSIALIDLYQGKRLLYC
jgi:hypothetical protein